MLNSKRQFWKFEFDKNHEDVRVNFYLQKPGSQVTIGLDRHATPTE